MQVINMVRESFLDAEEMKIDPEWKSKVPEGEQGIARSRSSASTGTRPRSITSGA